MRIKQDETARTVSVTARWRWWLVRRWRFHRTLAALREGRPDDAFRLLTHPGSVGDERAEALSAIAAVTARPSPENVAACVAVLERTGRALDPETIEVATDVLAPLLWQGPGSPPELVADVARLTARLMSVIGALPQGHYNLAVHALQMGEIAAATGHLAAGAAAPAGGWPLPVLGAACAVIQGEAAALARCLTEPVTDPDLLHDHRFFVAVHTLFECLRHDRQAPPDEVFDGPSGPLTRTVPQLSALKSLLTDAVCGGPPAATDLRGCAWGQWLHDRLHYAENEATRVLAACAMAGGGEPALVWQRFGARQDLLPLLSEEDARALRQQAVDFREQHASDGVWTRLVALRIMLGDEPTTVEAAPDPGYGPCPWWPTDGALQALAGREAEVERGYLEGRQLLRRGLPAEALPWFTQARGRLSGKGMATHFIDLRFGPLLDYWEGVALAHLGRHDEAAIRLRACANSVKAREAKAQLGLLAVAVGDRVEAVRLLASIGEPRPPAADHLAAILAVGEGDTAAATLLVERLGERETVAGIYLTAGHRLRGRLHEVTGELTEATLDYRRALARSPGDPVAVSRLARVWLRQRYDGAEVADEPLLDGQWSAPALVGSAAALPVLRDFLDGVTPSSAGELLDQVPADPGLRLLAVRSAIAAGATAAAERALRAWAGEEPDPDPRLVVTARVARVAALVRNLCQAGGRGPARFELAELERKLRSEATDPVATFWAESARMVLNHASVATAPPLPVLADESRPAPLRLFAGLMSMFSEDPEQRRAGAHACRAVMEAEAVRDAGIRATVRCLAAHVLEDEREFLAAYREIEAGTGTLPCAPAAVYLAATEARLRAGDLDAVIDGFIPEALADLADPGVRHAMGIAYARRAVRKAERDPRAALRDLDQARDLLGATTS